MEKKFQYKSEVQSIAIIRKDLEDLAESWGIPNSESRQIRLMLEELFSMIIRYAFEEKNNHLMEFTISMNEGIIHLLLSDDGIPFNPLDYTPEQFADPASSDDGGMGLSLIRVFADSIEYNRMKQKNHLYIQKTIRSQPETEQT